MHSAYNHVLKTTKPPQHAGALPLLNATYFLSQHAPLPQQPSLQVPPEQSGHVQSEQVHSSHIALADAVTGAAFFTVWLYSYALATPIAQDMIVAAKPAIITFFIV